MTTRRGLTREMRSLKCFERADGVGPKKREAFAGGPDVRFTVLCVGAEDQRELARAQLSTTRYVIVLSRAYPRQCWLFC